MPQQAPTGDALDYAGLAQRIWAGAGFVDASGTPEVLRPPLYPYVIAPFLALWGVQGVRVVQAVAGSVLPLLVLAVGRRTVPHGAAWAAAGLCAVYPPLIAYTGLLLTETIFSVTLTAAVLASLHAFPEGRLGSSVICGALLGASALIRAETILLVGAMGAVVALGPSRSEAGSRSRRIVAATLLLLGATAVVAPWTARNYYAFRAFIPVTTDGWRTLWIATYPGQWLEWRLEEPLLSIERGARNPVERQARFREAALANLREHPDAYLRMSLQRIGYLWVGSHTNIIAGLEVTLGEARGWKFVVKVAMLVLNTTLVVVGWWGAWHLRHRWADLGPVYVTVLALSVVYVLLFAVPRYHIPMLPELIILASGGFAALLKPGST